MPIISPADAGHKFAEIMQSVFAADLAGVILYGSAASSAYRKEVSDINILVILETSSPQRIFEAGKKANAAVKKYRITPLFMTREEFISSADVFPMEYNDIKAVHTVIFGDEQILNLQLNNMNLQLQLEEKLRGAVNDLRYMIFSAGGDSKLLGKNLSLWSGVGKTLFRNLLRLKGAAQIPANADDVLTLVGQEYNVSLDSFSILNRFQKGEKIDLTGLADSLLEALKALTKAVDSLSIKERNS